MKLAEALAERKANSAKIDELNQRLLRSLLVPEGDKPSEDPNVLLGELEAVATRLEALMNAINRTNLHATLVNGHSLTAAIARRDVLLRRIRIHDGLLATLGQQPQRMRGAEIKIVKTVDAAALQKHRDTLSQQYRELDTAIQAVNWTADLVE